MGEDKALFDPGFADLVMPFAANIEACDGVVGALKSLHQKKFKFKLLYPQIHKLIKNNIAFYYGCMLWAYYLTSFPPNTKILNNPFTSLTDEEIENYEITYDIEYLIQYLSKFENDSKYYLGKQKNIPNDWLAIAELYKEFLTLNNGFIKVKLTSDIILPNKFSVNIDTEHLKTLVIEAINEKEIETLLSLFNSDN